MIGAICCDNFGTLRGRIDILGAKVVKIYEIGKKIANLCYFNHGTIIKNKNYRKLNQNYPKLFIKRRMERMKRIIHKLA